MSRLPVMGLLFLARSPGSNPGVDVGISRELAATKLVMHTTKLNMRNPTDFLEAQSIKVLYKNIDRVIISMVQDLTRVREKIGYIVIGVKTWLIVKNSGLAESAKKVFDDEVDITLGAVIGSKEFKKQYCQEKVER